MLEALSLDSLSPGLLGLVAGPLLLLFGRKLYWGLVGVVGFFLGFYFARQYLDFAPEGAELLVAILVAATAALAAVFFQKLAVGAVGFVAGGYVGYLLAAVLAPDVGPWIWLAALVGGALGALLTRALFGLALVLISSALGAALVVSALGWQGSRADLLFVVLTACGVVLQLFSSKKPRSSKKKK